MQSTPAFQCSYLIDSDSFETELLDSWEDELISKLSTLDGSLSDVSMSYDASKSFDDELTRAVASDVGAFIITFVILSVFGSIMVLRFKRQSYHFCWMKTCCKLKFKIDPERSRAFIAIFGVLSSALAVAASFGIVGGIIGVKFNSVVSISPFLLVGLGVDDMFVLLRSYELTSSQLPVKQRIIITMQRGGVSIFFTSITDLIAFAVGTASLFGSVSAFCAYCSCGVFLDFLFQVSFFLGFMVYDARWSEQARKNKFEWSDWLCISKPKNTSTTDIDKDVDLQIRSISARVSTVQMKNQSDTDQNSENSNRTNVNNNVETISVGEDHDDSYPLRRQRTSIVGDMIDDQASSRLMEFLGEWMLKQRKVSFSILFLFVVYVAGGIYGITTLRAFTDPVDLAPNDSYLRHFYEDFESYFNVIGPPVVFVFDKQLDYSDSNVQSLISQFTSEVENDNCFGNPSLTSSWLASYLEYINSSNIQVNTSNWYTTLYSNFLNSNQGRQYIDSIWETITLTVNDTAPASSIGLSNINGDIIVNSNVFDKNSILRSRIYIQFKAIGTVCTK